jgi:hypothetical protein
VQGIEDELALNRAEYLRFVRGVGGGGNFTEPVEGRHAGGLDGDFVGEDGGRGTEAVLGGDEQALLAVVKIADHEEGTVNGGEQGERVKMGRIEGGREWPVERTHEEDGTVGALSEVSQARKERAHQRIAAGVGGVDDHETGIGTLDGGFEGGKVVGEREGLLGTSRGVVGGKSGV